MDLYRLLPQWVRQKDALTDSGEGPVLERVFWCLEQEADTTVGDISGLADLLNPDTCPTQYLPMLYRLLGASWPSDWPEARRRQFLKAVVSLYHYSGQRMSWGALLTLLGHSGFFGKELWKDKIYEEFDYSEYEGAGYAYGQYHAARVDIWDGVTTLDLTEAERATLDNVRPIHVLIRERGKELSQIDDAIPNNPLDSMTSTPAIQIHETLRSASDTCTVACESVCEASCEAGSCEGTFEVTVTCMLGCETGVE